MKILENNPQSISDYKAGKDRALGFLVGQAMKETKGKANPQMLNKMFLEELNKQRIHFKLEKTNRTYNQNKKEKFIMILKIPV